MEIQSKNEEMTRHMEEIWRGHTDPILVEKRRLKEKKEKKIKEIKEDYGIYT